MFRNPFSKDNQKVTIYKTHDERERDLFAGRLKKAGIWCQTRDTEMARNTASFGSSFIDIQKFAGSPDKDNRFHCIDVRRRDEASARELLGKKCRVMDTQLI